MKKALLLGTILVCMTAFCGCRDVKTGADTPTGYPSDEVQRITVYYNGRLYLYGDGGFEQPLDPGFEKVGEIKGTDHKEYPRQELYGTRLDVGQEVYANPKKPEEIYVKYKKGYAKMDAVELEEALPSAFGTLLWDVYKEGVLPDGRSLKYSEAESVEENQFAVWDADGDGQDELVLIWISSPVMAGKGGFVFGCDGGEIHIELSESFDMSFYENGTAAVEWSHNSHFGGRFWPRNFYHYEEESDSYKFLGSADAWDKELVKDGFPDEIDRDGDGLVYYLLPADWNGDYADEFLADGPAYEAWEKEITGGSGPAEIPYQKLTKENITALGFPEPETGIKQ